MKRFMITGLLLSLLATTHTMAQTTTGKVVYERRINMHKRLPPEAEQMKAMIPEFSTSKSMLLFNGNESLIKSIPDESEQMPTGSLEGGGPRPTFRFGSGVGPNDEIFRDYEAEAVVESRELGPKRYLIEDSLRNMKWKLEPDTMTIHGKLCYKATSTFSMNLRGGVRFTASANGRTTSDTNVQRSAPPAPAPVVAWYCPDVETKAGPDTFFGLPGLIMKVDVDNGTQVITAVSMDALGKETVKRPTQGKKITREEYRKMMEQQMQNMRMGPGGQVGGTRIMIQQ